MTCGNLIAINGVSLDITFALQVYEHSYGMYAYSILYFDTCFYIYSFTVLHEYEYVIDIYILYRYLDLQMISRQHKSRFQQKVNYQQERMKQTQ